MMDEKITQEKISKIIAQLKPLEAKVEELEKTVIAKLGDGSISFNELSYLIRNKGIIFSPNTLANIGLFYRHWGRNGFTEGHDDAYMLFEYAAQQKNLQGYFGCPEYLYEGSTSRGKNLEAALQFVNLANSGAWFNHPTILLLKVKICFELKNYKDANDLIQSILTNQKSTEENLKEANALQLEIAKIFFESKQYREALRFFRKIQPEKLCLQHVQKYAALKASMQARLRDHLDQTFPLSSEHKRDAKEIKERKTEMRDSVSAPPALEVSSIRPLKKKGWLILQQFFRH